MHIYQYKFTFDVKTSKSCSLNNDFSKKYHKGSLFLKCKVENVISKEVQQTWITKLYTILCF